MKFPAPQFNPSQWPAMVNGELRWRDAGKGFLRRAVTHATRRRGVGQLSATSLGEFGGVSDGGTYFRRALRGLRKKLSEHRLDPTRHHSSLDSPKSPRVKMKVCCPEALCVKTARCLTRRTP